MPLLDKQVKDPRRPGYVVYRRRRRGALLALTALAALLVIGAVGAWAYYNNTSLLFSSSSPSTQEQDQAQDQQDNQQQQQQQEDTSSSSSSSENTQQQTQSAPAAPPPPPPQDKTLYLTVPRLGLYSNTVRNDRSEASLDLGAIKLPETSFPWEGEGTNTYIACHRLGWPGTQSYHQCLNLPSMQKGDDIYLGDSNGEVYRYKVSEVVQVRPEETWVTQPPSASSSSSSSSSLGNREMVSLQTCIENYGDFATLGPEWNVRLVVRAIRVA